MALDHQVCEICGTTFTYFRRGAKRRACSDDHREAIRKAWVKKNRLKLRRQGKEWYAANKDRVLPKLRMKYYTDPRVRERSRKYNKKYHHCARIGKLVVESELLT